MRYRKYDNQDRPPELDLKVDSPRAHNLYQVVCRRRSTPGRITVNVPADTPEEAMQLVRDGKAQPGVGLGWIPVRAVDITPGG